MYIVKEDMYEEIMLLETNCYKTFCKNETKIFLIENQGKIYQSSVDSIKS